MTGNLMKRCGNIYSVLCLERWTQASRPASEMPLKVTWFGNAPRQKMDLPSYITEEHNEEEFEPKRPRKRAAKEMTEKSKLC
eukprot:symbB.v1.2.009695.t1/scaffold594.1/size183492/2